MDCAYITAMATNIWHDLGDPTDLSVSYIQSKLTSASFLGQLNVLLGECFTVSDGTISPALNLDQQGIYALMYEADFYTRKIAILAAGLSIPWVSIADGDSRIVRVSSVDLMRLYRDMQKNLNDQVNRLATTYRLDGTLARDVNFYNLVNGFGYGWGCGGYGSGALDS